jgi:hypothetical protein
VYPRENGRGKHKVKEKLERLKREEEERRRKEEADGM